VDAPLLLLCLLAFGAAGLTLFSGFGLATLLTPALVLLLPVESAVALVAVVHLLNNLFKLALLGRHADWGVAWRFGLPALPAALLGAWALQALGPVPPLVSYALWGAERQVLPQQLAVGLLMLLFAVWEVSPALARLQLPRRWLPLGGALSGFCGGLSGHQGALRAAFFARVGLSKEVLVATGVVVACGVDLIRLAVYGVGGAAGFSALAAEWPRWGLVVLAAWAGSYGASRLLPKVTIEGLQRLIAAGLLLIGLALCAGLL